MVHLLRKIMKIHEEVNYVSFYKTIPIYNMARDDCIGKTSFFVSLLAFCKHIAEGGWERGEIWFHYTKYQ